MPRIQRFEDMEVFQRARELTKSIYQATSVGRFARDFSLRDQIRRCAVSVMSNIAEGFERDGDREFLQFLSVAKGSCGELRAQLYAAVDQRYLTQEQFELLHAQVLQLARMLSGLIHYLRQSGLKGKKFR